MKKHLSFFWLKNLQNNKTSNGQKVFYYLSNEIINSYDKFVVKAYLDSIIRNFALLKKTKSIIVIPDILSLFSLDSTFDYAKTITRFQLNQELIRLSRAAKQEKIEIYQEIDISKLHSYRKVIDEVINQKNFEEKNLTENQSFLSHPIQFKRRPKLYDFLDTEIFNLSNYSEKDDTLQSELEVLISYFESEYNSTGIIFTSISKFIQVKDADDSDKKILNFKSILKKINNEKHISFLAIFSHLSTKNIIKEMLNLNIFETIIVKFEDYHFKNSKSFFKTVEKWNNQNVLLWINPNLINIDFENVARTCFYHFELIFVVTGWLLLSQKSFFITWPFFQEIVDGFETNSFEILENKYGYEQKSFLNNLKTENILIKILKDDLDLFLDPDFFIHRYSSLKKSFLNYFSPIKRYIIYTENKVFKIIFNLTTKKYFFHYPKKYIPIFSSFQHQERFINPYQFIVIKKK